VVRVYHFEGLSSELSKPGVGDSQTTTFLYIGGDMKAAVICRQHPIHFNGGLAIAAWNTARAAADAGVDVLFMTAQRPDGWAGVDVIDGVRVLWLSGAHHADYSRWHPVIDSVFGAYHKAEKFDLVHCHGYSGSPIATRGVDVPILFHDHGSKEGYAQSVLADSFLRTHPEKSPPNVSTFHDDVFFSNAQPAGEPDAVHMRQYDRVIATSRISFMDFRTRYMLTNARLLYHCIYGLGDYVYHIPNEVKPRVAVFAGDLDNPWKVGVWSLKKLLPIKDKILLILIGVGTQCAEFAQANFPQCRCRGHLLEKEAMEDLWLADVLFEPSTHHIGLNLTGISALGLGVPIVAYPTAGHYDLIGDDNEAGLVIDPVTDDVCDSIMSVIQHHKTKSSECRARFSRIFSPDTCSHRIKEIYEEVV
jgi:glycosyltransferase involved in cell wall biosynthesis